MLLKIGQLLELLLLKIGKLLELLIYCTNLDFIGVKWLFSGHFFLV